MNKLQNYWMALNTCAGEEEGMMSGGEWAYFSERIREKADDEAFVKKALDLLAQIEHELDWGYSGDTCPACAGGRVIAGLCTFFSEESDWFDGESKWMEVLTSRYGHQCQECRARDQATGQQISDLLDEGLGWPDVAKKIHFGLPYAREFYEKHWLKWQDDPQR